MTILSALISQALWPYSELRGVPVEETGYTAAGCSLQGTRRWDAFDHSGSLHLGRQQGNATPGASCWKWGSRQ